MVRWPRWFHTLFPGVAAYDEWHELWKVARLFLLLIGVCLVIASFVL